MSNNRYYDTSSKDIEVKPGRISKKLREALNLGENDVPVWIYRMRALGYPPGWLKKATVDTKDIFDTDDTETDRVTSSTSADRKRKTPSEDIQYDQSKLIEYPGFNTPLPPNTNDYHYYHNMPPMLPHQQLEHAKLHMNLFKSAPVSIKRNRLSSSPVTDTNNLSKNPTNTGDADGSHSSDEAQDPASPDAEETAETEHDKTSGDDTKQDEGESFVSSNNKSNLSKSLSEEIKLVSKGSPMPKPVERLPLERFSEGVVGDLLYFENTPSSSGKFNSIRGLLDTMRRSSGGGNTSALNASLGSNEEGSK